MQVALKLILLTILILSQTNSDYYTLMIHAQTKLATLSSELQVLKSYKFDYIELQKVTENASIAVSLMNKAQILHEKGNDSAAIELLIQANNLLDTTLVSAQNYVAKVEIYNNQLRLIAALITPIAALLTSYISLFTYNYVNRIRIKRLLESYIILKKKEDE